nr:hypothetical protein KK1_015534 [Cajanus cajan]
MEDLFKTRFDSGSHSPSVSKNSNGARGSNQYSCGTRLARIDFPRFNGENINQWMYQCENCFLIDATPEDVKVWLAIVHLEGKALQWHTAISKNLANQQPSWEEYTKMLQDRFGDVCDDPMAELMKLRQEKGVSEYHEAFDAIISRLDFTKEYRLSCFLGGLKHEIQMMVRMFRPDSVRRAFSLAKMYEASQPQGPVAIASKPFSLNSRNNKNVMNSRPLLPTSTDQVKYNQPEFTSNKAKPYRNLTPTYMADRRSKGLCYFCDEPYSQAHNLTHKKLQLHVIEVEEASIDPPFEEELPDSDSADMGEPQISVHALTGIPNFKIM